MERYIQWMAIVIFTVIFAFALRRPPLKDWVLIFFVKSYLSILVSKFVTAQGRIEYPARFLPQIFPTSILFEVFVFPILCVCYNQTTYRSGIKGIIGQAVLYSAAMTALEFWLEKNTELIIYLRWSWVSTFVWLLCSFVGVRAFMAGIRYFAGE